MNEVLEQNLSVIEQRWPYIYQKLLLARLDTLTVEIEQNTLIVNNVQLTSNYDRQAEAQLQCEQIPSKENRAFVYGVGLGDVPKELLLRKNISSVVVCILNMDLFLHSLNAIEHFNWLSDSRISLTTAQQLPEICFPFVALPTEITFADDYSAVLRDRIMLEIENEYIKSGHSGSNINAALTIAKNMKLFHQDEDVSSLFNSFHETIYIAAAGPTLDEHKELLSSCANEPNSILIALDAALNSLLVKDVSPDFVVTIDEKNHQIITQNHQRLDNKTSLIYFPITSSEILKNWSGKRYCSYMDSNVYKKVNEFYPRTNLFSAGSVIHVATDLAVKMGAKKIVFLGADFGFPDNKTYASGQDHQHTKSHINSEHWVLNGKGEKITTMLNYRGYLRDLERYIALKKHVKFINGSDRGAKIEGTVLLKDIK